MIKNTLVLLTQVLLELVPELAKDHHPLNNGILHQETHWLVMVTVKDPVLRLVCSRVQVQKQWLHRHLDLLCAGILLTFNIW